MSLGEDGEAAEGRVVSLSRTSSKLYAALERDSSGDKGGQQHELEVRLAMVDEEVELVRTPSAQQDIDAATAAGLRSSLILRQAGRAQRLRAQLRALDADIAEVKSDLVRASILRGPSGNRFTCDEMCVVGGCSEEFSEDDGIYCPGCRLFLCHPCFGASAVQNECQIGGRFDSDLCITVENEQRKSSSGSLPCPLFPQECPCGHIPLHKIQRALLHRRNRGRDGEQEDVNSPGTSPHKTYLLARRRWAEEQVGDQQDGFSDEGDGVALVRTLTETRRMAATQGDVLVRNNSGARSAIADKLSELAELRSELAANPVAAAIPKPKLRTCAQCQAQCADFEGGQCLFMRHSHFMCAVCYGGYIMRACSVGGSFEQEICNDTGVVISARGQLPCPFFEGHSKNQLLSRTPPTPGSRSEALGLDVSPVDRPESLRLPELEPKAEPEPQQLVQGEPELHPQQLMDSALPCEGSARVLALDCHCGAVPSSVIETILLDPRNRSYQYWRERHAEMIVQSQANLQVSISIQNHSNETLPPGWERERDELSGSDYYLNSTTGELRLDPPPAESWSREVELLGRSFTPQNIHDTARLRVAIAENLDVRRELERLEEARNELRSPDDVALAELRMQVIDALDRGGSIRCPRCGVRAVKDDACIHMDSCPCGSHWCFLCTKENCPRGGGGCDETSYYLEQHPGWGNFALPNSGENQAYAAQQEFLRRRQAFMVGAVKAHTDPELWTRLREQHEDLLQDVPTKGRHIDWDTLDAADEPLFGANKRRAEANGGDSVDAQRRRMQEHWANVRAEEELDRRRDIVQRRMEQCCVPVVTTLIAALVIFTACMLEYFPPESPMVLREDDAGGSSLSGHNADGLPSHSEAQPSATASGSWSGSTSHDDNGEFVSVACIHWDCQTLIWGPRGQFAIGGLLWMLCLCVILCKQGCYEMCKYFCTMLLLGAAGYWTLMMSPMGLLGMHWALAYFLCAACTGVVQPLFIAVPLATILDTFEHLESGSSCLLFVAGSGCQLCLWMFLYIGALVSFRSNEEVPEHIEVENVAHGGDEIAPVPEPYVAFECGFLCSAIPWFSRVQAALGLLALLLAGIGWLKQAIEHRPERHKVFQASMFVLMSAVVGSLSLWPSTLSDEATCTTAWGVAYILAPLCVGVIGPLWVAANCMCSLFWLQIIEEGNHDDKAFGIAACIGCCCGLGFYVSIIITRFTNSDWEPTSPDWTDLECNAWCEVLFSAPLVQVGTGAICMLICAILKVQGRRDYDWSDFGVAVFLGVLAWWPAVAFFTLFQTSVLTTNAWLATIVLPVWTGTQGTLWNVLGLTVTLEHIRDLDVEQIFPGPEIFVTGTLAACILSTVGYMASTSYLRDSVNLDRSDLSPQQPEALYDFICTWPCRLVWALFSGALGFGLVSAVFVCRSLCAGHNDNRVCINVRCRRHCSCRCVVANVIQTSLSVAVIVFVFFPGVYGLAVPVQELVVGNALRMYLLVPGMTVVGVTCTWKTLLWVSSPRTRMLSRLYKATTVVGSIALVGSTWLLYVLRYSVETTKKEWSYRSRLIIMQTVGLPYIGIALMLWCWGTRRGQARHHACSLIARPLIFWVPAATWPLVAAAVSDDRQILDRMSLVWPLGSLSFSLTGFSFEIAWFYWNRRRDGVDEVRQNGSSSREFCCFIAMCMASGLLLGVTNAILLAS